MASRLNLVLPDELSAFVDSNCGPGTLYADPSEYVCDLLRQKKTQVDAKKLRQSIVAGYQDAIAGRTVRFKGNLRTLLRKSGK